MKNLLAAALLSLVAMPLLAQRRVDLIVDVEGVRRTGEASTEFTPNEIRYEPRFGTGGGLGVGVNWFFSDRVSLETKVAALESNLRVRIAGSDYIAFANLGRAQIYPITAIVQWHLNEHGAIRPYLGAGAGYILLHNVSHKVGSLQGVEFEDPIGFVIDGGLEWRLSSRWGLSGDVRYVPIESKSNVTFTGTQSAARIHVKPLLASAGVVYHF
jgi:outer membrane protein